MRIRRLRLNDFKAHDRLELEPAAGLTIIRGPNEAGKSSIQQAIELVLFRKADSNREDIRRAWSWSSEAAPEIELEFEADDGSGTVRKRFGGARAEAELKLDGRVVGDYQAMQDELTGLIGVPTESFYRATASVSHADLGAVAGAEPAIGDRLQKAVSGADRGTARARKKLEAAVHRYRTAGHKNPGLLKVARAEIDQLEADLLRGEESLRQLQADRALWVEADARRGQLEQLLNRQQADLAEAQRAEELAERRDAAQDRYERFKRAAVLLDESAELQRTAATSMPLAQLRSTVSRLGVLEFETSELEAEVATTAEAASADEPEEVPPRPMAWLLAAAILVVLGWAAMFLLRDAGLLGVAIVAVIAVGVAVTLVQAARLAGRRRRYGLAMQLAEYASAQHEEQSRDQQEQLRRKQRELEGMLGSLGVADIAAASVVLETAEKQAEQLAKIEGELRGLGVEEGNRRRLEEARDQAANEAEQARHALAAMGSLAEDPAAARTAAQREVARTTPARDAARSEADQALGRIDANPIDAELVASLSERLAVAREREAELQRRLAVYEGTLAAIDAAERATLKTAARYLEERMGPTIAAVTDGRYVDIEIDQKSLAFKVRAPETGELVEVDRLSQGTADQLFLAARLGLVRLVTLDRRPPLILDDPFVTFDAERGERALRLVKAFAHEHGFQVLYLTCSDRFDTLADELVVLPGPSAGRVPPAPDEPASAPGTPEPAPGAPDPALALAPDRSRLERDDGARA
jgi:DNA repair exonuclease SbcCD ATPase subunit